MADRTPRSDRTPDEPKIWLAVHDASRLEWTAELPLPDNGGETQIELDLSLEIPANVWSPHEGWDRLQLFARLASPLEEAAPPMPARSASVDELRRATLVAVQRLKVVREEVVREIFTAASLFSRAPRHSLGDDVLSGIHRGLAELSRARAELGQARSGEPPEISRERTLATEFLSHHALAFLSKVQRTVDEQLRSPRCRHKTEYEEVARHVGPQIARALGDELQWRREHGLQVPHPEEPEELERHVERGSILKKHFQEVLFLRLESERVDVKLRNWLAGAAAVLASLWAFPLGLWLTTDKVDGVGVGFGATLAAFAVMYAVKDRIKENFRGWLAERITRTYGGRLTTMTSPPRLLEREATLGRLRESFESRHEVRPDPLNPDMAATRKIVVYRYVVRGSVHGDPRLTWQGLTQGRLVFRYDLSPLFLRLDDAVKRVPVLADGGRAVKFAEAPRSYRLPITARLRIGGAVAEDAGQLVAHKLGLERIERSSPLSVASPSTPLPAVALRRR